MIILPTIDEIRSDIIAKFETEFSATIPVFGKNFIRVFSTVLAGVVWLMYKSIGFTQKNIFIDTADSEENGGTLERFGRVKLKRNRFPATAGSYSIQLSGTLGTVIPASTRFKSNDDVQNPNKLFILDTSFTLDGIDVITVRSLESGLDAQLFVGDILTVTGPVAGLDSEAEVVAELIEPQAAESIEDYREKGLQAYQLEPQGGSGSDYRIWATDAQGVKQSYPYASSGFANEIELYIEATIADSTDGFGTPTTAILTAVEESIELPTASRPSRKPLGVYEVHYLPVSVKPIDISIIWNPAPSAAVQTAISEALDAAIYDVRPFVSSIDILADKNDTFGENNIVSIILNAAPGSSFGAVEMLVDSVQESSHQFLNGDIPYLNSVTYV